MLAKKRKTGNVYFSQTRELFGVPLKKAKETQLFWKGEHLLNK